MEVKEFISGARDAVSVKRVYGDPYVTNGLTVIPAATVRGGAGQGMGDHEGGDSTGGGGFGLAARPAGAWIIEDGRASWKPAIDVNRVVLGAQAIALTAILVTGRILLAHSRPRPKYAELMSRMPTRRRRQFRLPERRMRVQMQMPKLTH
jgi:hypothetical protein